MVKRDQSPKLQSCGLSLREHIDKVFVALLFYSGLGGGCVDTYRALVEVAEFIRRDQGFPAYEAQLTDELVKEANDAAEALKLQEATRGVKVGQA
jgi:hypothetical protein